MTTTYDVEQTESAPVFHDTDPTEVVSAYDDPQTVIAAWSSSALGELDGELTDGFTETRERQPAAARAKLFAAVAAGIIGGATLGAVLFGYRDIAPPTVVVPGFGVSTEQLPGQSTTPSTTTHVPQMPAAAQTPAPKPVEKAVAPNPVAAESKTNEEVAAAPAAPPVVAPPVVVDVFIPPLGDKPKPQAPAPEPPAPKPPVFNPGNIDVAQIPDESDADSPNIVIEAPILDPAMTKPTTNELKPVPSSRWTTKLPDNKPNQRNAQSGHKQPRNPGQVVTMTAAADWDIVGPYSTDAELALACAAGDRAAWAGIYDRYADRLHDFCWGMLRDRDGAADCVQDVFCIAATRMAQLRDPDRLRPWLYSIARSEALRRIRDRNRETVSDDLPDAVSDDPSPETIAARGELADLVSDAAGGLSDRDRSVLELAYRHGMDGADLAEALGVTQVNANTIVHRLRETVERALGALLVSRGVHVDPDRCAELAAVLDGWDGTFTVLMRKRVARHIEGCATCDEERRRLVNPVALLGAAPVFIPAPAWLRERTLGEVELTTSASPFSNDHDGGTRHTSSSKLPAALFLAALVAALGLSLVWLQQVTTTAVSPVQVSDTPRVAPAGHHHRGDTGGGQRFAATAAGRAREGRSPRASAVGDQGATASRTGGAAADTSGAAARGADTDAGSPA